MRRFRKATGSRLCGDSDNERRTLGGAGDYVDAPDLVLRLRIVPGQPEQPQRRVLRRRSRVGAGPSQDSPADVLRLVGVVPPNPQILGVNERDFLVGPSGVMDDILANLDSISFTTSTGVQKMKPGATLSDPNIIHVIGVPIRKPGVSCARELDKAVHVEFRTSELLDASG